MRRLGDLPKPVHKGFVYVVNMSGGKDSTALRLAFIEADVPHRAVFADTGWEAKETYAYLDLLREKTGPIDVVGHPGGMAAKIRDGARFASRRQRWCTKELKVQLLREYCDKIEDEGVRPISCVGIRREEGTDSNGRREALEFEYDTEWEGYIWRPLLEWTVEDDVAIHHRHGVPLNPLYHRGHSRVGCYPCVMASKEDIRLVAEHAPERIDLIRDLERSASAERIRRNEETPGRYEHVEATFFLTTQRARGGAMGIDDIVAWSRTTRGGKERIVLPTVPDGGCFRWGFCEAPAAPGKCSGCNAAGLVGDKCDLCGCDVAAVAT